MLTRLCGALSANGFNAIWEETGFCQMKCRNMSAAIGAGNATQLIFAVMQKGKLNERFNHQTGSD
jgi:hypothetical protein